jgi:predicted N-formylglutamate amidohydrolase
MSPPDRFLITCEHGGNRIPFRYRRLFQGHEALLDSHRGYDAGALAVASDLAAALRAPLFKSTVSRLLIDLNRSPGHARLYSDITRATPPAMREEIRRRHYLPYRQRVEEWIESVVSKGERVVHISSHSFTPVLDGEVRKADVGLLYDPARPGELDLCRCWGKALKQLAPALRVRRNYPYRGKSDGLTRWLRQRFPAPSYVGIELEINHQWALRGGAAWLDLRRKLRQSLALCADGLRATSTSRAAA